MKRIVLLATAALVAMMILVPTAMAQDTIVIMEDTVPEPLPPSGGFAPSVILPAAALLLGAGALTFAVLRRR
ncbi:MAG: hypothetical protein M3M97_08235 [Actinomycetota bacterium]|nr:hypothetical protein [Actinomycetota bacterium]